MCVCIYKEFSCVGIEKGGCEGGELKASEGGGEEEEMGEVGVGEGVFGF